MPQSGKTRKKPGPKPGSGRGQLPIVLPIRGRQEWSEAVKLFARANGISPAELADQAIRARARRAGVTLPPRI